VDSRGSGKEESALGCFEDLPSQEPWRMYQEETATRCRRGIRNGRSRGERSRNHPPPKRPNPKKAPNKKKTPPHPQQQMVLKGKGYLRVGLILSSSADPGKKGKGTQSSLRRRITRVPTNRDLNSDESVEQKVEEKETALGRKGSLSRNGRGKAHTPSGVLHPKEREKR